MIDPRIAEFLGIPRGSYNDYLFIVMPDETASDSVVLNWIQNNYARGCLVYYHSGNTILQINNAGRKILTNQLLDAAIDTHSAILKGKVCIATEVNTSLLDVNVPVGYNPPYDQVLDSEGNVLRQKTVREYMIHTEGSQGKSLIFCAEKKDGLNGSGLQQDEVLRFRSQFPNYYVFSDEQLSAWIQNNTEQEV